MDIAYSDTTWRLNETTSALTTLYNRPPLSVTPYITPHSLFPLSPYPPILCGRFPTAPPLWPVGVNAVVYGAKLYASKLSLQSVTRRLTSL